MSRCRLLIIQNAVARVGLILTLSLLYPGCQSLLKPTELKPSSGQPAIKPLSSRQLEYVDDMFRRIDFTYSPRVEKKNYDSQIKHCLSFLVKEFGQPLYRGRVTLRITDNPADNGKMSWSDGRRRYRTMALHEWILYPDLSELHVLVHELFHAFYQTNAFIKANPDFITEGLAVYAEYKYRYWNWNNKKILKEMREQSKALAASVKYQPINFDTPFQSYGDRQIDPLYILSGSLFFSQDTKTINKKIRYILQKGSVYNSRRAFDELINAYGLKRTGPFLAETTAIALQLAEPGQLRPYIRIAYYENRGIADSTAKHYLSLGYQTEFRKHPQKKGRYLLLGPFRNDIEAKKVKIDLLRNDQRTPKDIKVEYFKVVSQNSSSKKEKSR